MIKIALIDIATTDYRCLKTQLERIKKSLQKAFKEFGLEIVAQANLKSDSHLPKKLIFICFNKSPLKMMKNAF